MIRNKVHDRKAFDPNAFYAEQYNKANYDQETLEDPHKKYYKFPITRGQAKMANLKYWKSSSNIHS